MMVAALCACFGVLVGGILTSMFYERRKVREIHQPTPRISQLDVFEVPERIRSSWPPSKRRTPSETLVPPKHS